MGVVVLLITNARIHQRRLKREAFATNSPNYSVGKRKPFATLPPLHIAKVNLNMHG